MSDLRPTAGVFEKIRHLPDLLSRICIRGQIAWRGEIKLVASGQKREARSRKKE
jgi:hypothetical protein